MARDGVSRDERGETEMLPDDRYFDELRQLEYAKALKENWAKAPKIRGYVSEGEYTRALESSTMRVAGHNSRHVISTDYAMWLAVARSACVPPYGEAGRIALEEQLGVGYDPARLAVRRLKEVLGRPIADQERVDLYYLCGKQPADAGAQVAVSGDAKVVRAVEEVMRILSLLTQEEKKQNGGIVLEPALLDGLHFEEDGEVHKSPLYEEISAIVAGRDQSPDRETIEKVKERVPIQAYQ